MSGNLKNALALYARALSYSSNIASHQLPEPTSQMSLNIEVTKAQVTSLHNLLEGLVAQYRALVEIQSLNDAVARSENSTAQGTIPMIERLDEYPSGGVNLSNLVVYPPRLRPIPVKPIFLDVAWTYIDYPDRAKKGQPVVNETSQPAFERAEEKKEARKGWFGFGR